MIKVTITVEQTDMTGSVPVSQTWVHTMGGTDANPAYAADAQQAAVVEAAADVADGLSLHVDRRPPRRVITAFERLAKALEIGP
jgi:hypothetical protein